jgi:hypothetical protein
MSKQDQMDKKLVSKTVPPGGDPDRTNGITRRIFLRRSLAAGAVAGAAASGLFPFIQTIDVAYGAEPFRFAWISDTHLYPKTLNTRFVEKAERAVNDVKAMKPAPDFMIFGGDLAQLGDPVELQLGADILKGIRVK